MDTSHLNEQAAGAALVTADPHLSNVHILIVDDVSANRDLLLRRLRRMGIGHVDQAADGSEALQKLLARSQHYSLVLLDIMMPGVSGFEVLERLQATGMVHEIPFVMVSALSEMDAVVRCVQLGAEDYLFKPFDPTLLRARVLASLDKKRLRDQLRAQLARAAAEMAEARSLQLALIPVPWRGPGVSVDAVLVPAREVGGDFVDHFAVGPLQVTILGDVSDKGAGAALVMARIHALFRGLMARPDAEAMFADPSRALGVVNDELAHNNEACMFATCLLAVMDEEGGLAYARAGHVPPWVLRRDGVLERLRGQGGLPLGMVEGVRLPVAASRLEPGDRLLVVSDGVTEAADRGGIMLGDAGVDRLLHEGPADESGPALLARLLAAVRAHEDGAAQSDDVAALLLARSLVP